MEPESSAEPSLRIAELMLHVADVFTFSVKDCEQFLLGGAKYQLKGTTATIRMMSILRSKDLIIRSQKHMIQITCLFPEKTF